ncbi:MAG: hypothetical protein J7639_25805 [Paenibacillaceae bacterium]|nr:hypothetical protein [Paenibacillaceae bacterium]
MRIFQRWRRWLADQQGISLIEILGAVTILSIISVTLMGYFVSGMEKSADASRRNIAANLARLKVAEIREEYHTRSAFDQFVDSFAPGTETGTETYRNDDALPLALKGKNLLTPVAINGTEYRFTLTVQPTARIGALEDFTSNDSPGGMGNLLFPLSVTVDWDDTETPHAAKQTTIDTYLVNREGL